MALCTRNGLFQLCSPFVQIKRFRGKINIKKPKQPHYERAVFVELSKPYFQSTLKNKLPFELCKKSTEKLKLQIDNPYERIVANEIYEQFIQSSFIGFYHMNSITGEDQFRIQRLFKKEQMILKNYGRAVMEKAIKNTKYETILDFFVSRNMLLFSPEPDLKKILKIGKKYPQLVLLAGIYEDKLISKDQIMELSQIPNLQSAQAGLVQILNSAGTSLTHKLTAHQNALIMHLGERKKQLEEE